MKHLFTITILLCSFSICQAQYISTDTLRHSYMTLKSYELMYQTSLTKQDTLDFMYRDNDTLVLLKNHMKLKGVSVPYEYKDSTFLHYYKKIAFRTKGIDSLDRKQTMRYWKTPIKVYFSNSVSKKTKKGFMSFAKTVINQVDSLQISEVKKVEESNYIVYYFGDYEYESRMVNNKTTDYYLSWNEKQQIYRCSIKLDSDLYFNETLIQNKLQELFVSSLGNFYFIDDFSCESYFSNCYSKNKQLTPLDIELLQYHYSYCICKGTNLKTFEEQHKLGKKSMRNGRSYTTFFHPYNE